MSAPILEAVGLSCGYGSRQVLAEVSLAVHPGEIVALIGPNGSGKTTLLHALDRLIRPWAGDVRLQGASLWSLPAATVARQVALAPQQAAPSAWPLTVREAVELGRSPHRGWLRPLIRTDQEVVDQAMTRLGVAALAGRSVATLSGGELRRVLLARALAQSPRVLVLDEPITYLDLHYQSELLSLMRRWAHEDGLAVIWTVHDLALAGLCADRVALLAEGRLRALGPAREVLTRERLVPVYGENVEIWPRPGNGAPVVLPKVDGGKAETEGRTD